MEKYGELIERMCLASTQLQMFRQLIRDVLAVCPLKPWQVEPERGLRWVEVWLEAAVGELQKGPEGGAREGGGE
jgi:hypothetical protein